MKNNFNTTEELLEKGKTIRLSVSEHNEMKSTLLSYAKFHGMKDKPTKSIFAVSSIWMRSVASASLALMLFIGTGYASTNSLPGEFLYPVKTNVVEELTATTKLTPLSQLEYHHKRHEVRLFELQALSERGPLSAAALRDLQTELIEISEEVDELMDGEDKIEDTVALELISDMVAMSNATEEMVRSIATREHIDMFVITTDNLELVQDSEVTDFLNNSTSTIETFIESQLSIIGAELAENYLKEVTTMRVRDYIEDAEISLQDGDHREVVNLVSDAVTLIKSKEYLNDYQDEIMEQLFYSVGI